MTIDSKPLCDRIWRGARIATMAAPPIDDGVIACRDGRIIYAGEAASALAFDAPEIIQCNGRWITPGLIDCHTHLIYASNRAGEFAQSLAGATYEEIARAGGGIVSTMNATRAASEDALV